MLEGQPPVQQQVQPVPEAAEQPVQQSTTPAPRAKRKTGTTAGSSADARRREANRLAAERSRNRQHEKIIALEMAVQALGDENLKLKEEIERLEGREEGGASQDMPTGEQTATTVADVEAATAAAINAADSQNQQGNLLAALLSSSGSNIDELTATLDPESEQSWMRGVESLFKDEVDVSGRLGELAAVAAGQEGDGNIDQSSQGQTPTGDALSEGSRSRGGSVYGGTMPALATSTASAVAVAINTEMEKLLREDTAKTKAAIARVERELMRARGQPVYEDGANDDSIPLPATIPKDILEADSQALLTKSEEIKNEMAKAESEAAVLREVVSRMRAARSEDQQKVDGLVSELKELEMDGGEREREQIAGLLRGLRAHVTTRMNAPGVSASNTMTCGRKLTNSQNDFNAGPLMTPFASPATARRKRGRPPKQAALPAKYVYSLMYSSPIQSPGGSPEASGEASGTSSTRGTRSFSRGRSRLANEIRLDNEAGPSNTVDSTQATAHDDYLLSHLTQAADGSRDAQLPLDSTSFAAFLPPSPHDQAVAQSQPATMEHALTAPTQTEEVAQEPNILSRLRRGPPGSCEVCGRTHTSVWRKLTFHGEDLKVCNGECILLCV